jgi:hypothetical protein
VATSRRLLSIALTFSAIACAADPTLLNLVMPDARMLFGVNVENILASPIGKQISSQMRSSAPELQLIIQSTGFDPTRDLKEILVASTGQGQDAPTVVLVRGSFDIAKFSSFSADAGQAPTDYEGVSILTHPARKSSAFAFLDNTTAIAGELDQVRAAIHRRSRVASLGPVLAAKVAALSQRYDVWAISTVSLASMAAKAGSSNLQQMSDLLKAIRQVSGGVRFAPDMELAAELVAATEKDAGSIRDTLSFFSSFLAANQQNPSGLKPDAFKVSVNARTVRISLTVTEEELKKAYQAQMARNAMRPAIQPVIEKPRPVDTGLVIQSSDRDMGTVNLPPAKKN